MKSDIGANSLKPGGYRSSIVRRILGNFAIVLGGNGLTAVLGLIALGLNARALGTEGIGALALITTTAALVTRVFAFQSWVPLIKLGAEALETGDRSRVANLARVGLVLDFGAGLIGTIFGIAFVLLAGPEIGIPAYLIAPAAMYMLSIATGATDTASGLLRLLNRFAVVTTIQIVGAAVGCLYAALLYVLRVDLTAYVIGYAAIAATTNCALQIAGLTIARRTRIPIGLSGMGHAWRQTGREMLSQSLTTSLSGTIYVVRDNAPHLVIGAVLGPAAVGLYHVAARVAGILSMVMWAINQSVYPETAKLAASRFYAELHSFVLWTSAWCGGIGSVAVITVILVGQLALTVIGGPIYSDAYWPLVLLTSANALSLTGVTLRAALLATVGPITLLHITAYSFVAFVAVMLSLLHAHGLSGAALAQVAFDSLSLAIGYARYKSWHANGSTHKGL